MNLNYRTVAKGIALAFALAPLSGHAFDSGSTGALGALNPTVSIEVPLPPDGILNYTTVNIPSGVVVTFKKNAANTPVVILANGDVTVAGQIDVRGTAATAVGAASDGNPGDDGLPGQGGPGAFDGGAGGLPGYGVAGAGQGPGAGYGGRRQNTNCGNTMLLSGSGGGHGGRGGASHSSYCSVEGLPGGAAYGSSLLLPLIGGSGGGGGGGGSAFTGGGGGAGGGAILIASSGIVTVTGSVVADGTAGGSVSGAGVGHVGGGGSGGAIRIVATQIAGNGSILARGATHGTHSNTSGLIYRDPTGDGAHGRIRLEAETITRTAATTPGYSFGEPGQLFLAGLPTLSISSVAGQAAPAVPTGSADITLPADTPNPVVVTFSTTGVPVGNTVTLTLTPQYGAVTSAVSEAITGTTEAGAASVSIDLPNGPSVLQAKTSYTIVAAVGDLLKHYAGNERVKEIEVVATLGAGSKTNLVTVSGKRYEAPAEALRIAAFGG